MRRRYLCVFLGLIACVPERRPTGPAPAAHVPQSAIDVASPGLSPARPADVAPTPTSPPSAPEPRDALPAAEALAPGPEAASTNSAARLPAFEIEPPYAAESAPAPATRSVAASVAAEELGRWNVGGSSAPDHPSNRSGFHPAVRVVVNTTALRRIPKEASSRAILTQSRLQAVARNNGYWPFRLCFEEALQRAPARRGGETRIRISIVPSGAVTAARLLRDELRDSTIARCLLQAARRLRLTPGPHRRLDVDLSVELWPGDLPVRAPTRAAAQPPPFHREVVKRVAEGAADRLARCYLEALDRDPKLWGRLAVRFVVGEDGRVSSAREQESQFPDPEVTRCVIRTIEEEGPKLWAGPLDFVLAVRCGTPPSTAAVTENPSQREGPLRDP